MREKGVPEKYVRIVQDMYGGARTKVQSSVVLTRWINVQAGLHEGLSISPCLFDLVMDVMSRGIKDQAPWCMLFADDIFICCTSREEVKQKTECWRRALEDRGLKVCRSKTEYLCLNYKSGM